MAGLNKRQLEILNRYDEAANASLNAPAFSPWTFINRKSAEIPLWLEMPRGYGATPEPTAEFDRALEAGAPSMSAYRQIQTQQMISPAMKRLRRYNP